MSAQLPTEPGRYLDAFGNTWRLWNDGLFRMLGDSAADPERYGPWQKLVVAEEPDWEYGTIRSVVDGWERGDRYGDGSYVDARSISDRLNHDPSTITGARTLEHAVRRRKAGPWVPVKQEGADGG